MKRKILATAIAAIAAVTCAIGLTACAPDNGGPPEPTALENAYASYRTTQNMTVTVTDSRTEKHGTDYSTSVKIDYEHKAAYANKIHNTVDHLGDTHYISYESYYEITDKPDFIIYSRYLLIGESDGTYSWNVINRDDLFNLPAATTNPQFEIQLFTDFVNDCLPSHALFDTGWRVNENDASHWASLNTPELLNKFTKSASGYTASLYFCINIDGSTFVPYACTVTIKLDSQDRFESVIVDFGTNGKIEAEYVYGATTVTIPEEAKNSSSNN